MLSTFLFVMMMAAGFGTNKVLFLPRYNNLQLRLQIKTAFLSGLSLCVTYRVAALHTLYYKGGELFPRKRRVELAMKNQGSLLCSDFWARFSVKWIYFSLLGALFCGLLVGAVFSAKAGESDVRERLFFSGVPALKSGFLSCFSTILLNLLACLIILFLLGVTAFGVAAIPLFLFLRSSAVGITAVSLLLSHGMEGVAVSALCYLPAASGSSLLLLLFATRALAFSNSLRRAGFAGGEQGSLNFRFYFHDFLAFVCFSVILSFVSSLLAMFLEIFI